MLTQSHGKRGKKAAVANLQGTELQARIDSAVSQADRELRKLGVQGFEARGSKAEIWNGLGGKVPGFATQAAFAQDLARHFGGTRSTLTSRSLPVKRRLLAAVEQWVSTKKRKGVPRHDEEEEEDEQEQEVVDWLAWVQTKKRKRVGALQEEEEEEEEQQQQQQQQEEEQEDDGEVCEPS